MGYSLFHQICSFLLVISRAAILITVVLIAALSVQHLSTFTRAVSLLTVAWGGVSAKPAYAFFFLNSMILVTIVSSKKSGCADNMKVSLDFHDRHFRQLERRTQCNRLNGCEETTDLKHPKSFSHENLELPTDSNRSQNYGNSEDNTHSGAEVDTGIIVTDGGNHQNESDHQNMSYRADGVKGGINVAHAANAGNGSKSSKSKRCHQARPRRPDIQRRRHPREELCPELWEMSAEDVNQRAEEFIARFRQQMHLQRQQSLGIIVPCRLDSDDASPGFIVHRA